MTDLGQQTTDHRPQIADQRHPIAHLQSLIFNLLVFGYATLVAIVLLEQNAILGFAAALVGGSVFGALGILTREANA